MARAGRCASRQDGARPRHTTTRCAATCAPRRRCSPRTRAAAACTSDRGRSIRRVRLRRSPPRAPHPARRLAVGSQPLPVEAVRSYADAEMSGRHPQEVPRDRLFAVTLPEPEVEMVFVRPLVRREANVPVDSKDAPVDARLGTHLGVHLCEGCARSLDELLRRPHPMRFVLRAMVVEPRLGVVFRQCGEEVGRRFLESGEGHGAPLSCSRGYDERTPRDSTRTSLVAVPLEWYRRPSCDRKEGAMDHLHRFQIRALSAHIV